VARTSFAVSVVIEWYNVTHAEISRAKQMLAALKSQAAALHFADRRAPVGLSGPLELVIAFNSAKLDSVQVRRVVDEVIGATEWLTLRYLPVASASYCQLKNAGAAIATGEIIIFLDSDVNPEPEWLVAFLCAFADPSVSVAVGNTYVDCGAGDVYSKSLALTWMFPLRDSDGGITVSDWFYANNAAFRRETFLSRQFPNVPGLIHAPAKLLVERLERDGVTIWHVGEARASHPAPNGLVHFVERAVSAGRARTFSAESVTIGLIFRWVFYDIGSVRFGFKKIVLHGFKLGLRWWQMPSAMTITVTYFALLFAGSLLSVVAPRFMRDRFRL
jgi:hypothetical protein